MVCARLRSFLESPHTLLDELFATAENVTVTRGLLATAREWSKRLSSGAGDEKPVVHPSIGLSHCDWPGQRLYFCSIDKHCEKYSSEQLAIISWWQKAPTPKPRSKGKTGTLRRRNTVCTASGFNWRSDQAPAYSLINAIVRARDWYDRFIRGELTSIRAIAATTGLDERYVSRIFPFAFLAPDIVQSILDGRLEHFRTNPPADWTA